MHSSGFNTCPCHCLCDDPNVHWTVHDDRTDVQISVHVECTHVLYSFLLSKNVILLSKMIILVNKTSFLDDTSLYTGCVLWMCTLDAYRCTMWMYIALYGAACLTWHVSFFPIATVPVSCGIPHHNSVKQLHVLYPICSVGKLPSCRHPAHGVGLSTNSQ